MWYARWLLALALVVGLSCSSSAPRTTALVASSPVHGPCSNVYCPVELLEAGRAAAVVLRASGGGGSGVCVAQDDKEAIVLTAAHVVEGELEILIGTEAGKTYPGRVIYENKVLGLAAVVTLPVFTHVARMAPANEGYRFWPVMAYGFPALVGPDGHPTFGMVASERDTMRDCVADHAQPDAPCVYVVVKFWRITAPIFFGNSGGAVYVRDDKGWALIGVAQRVAGGGGSVASHVGFISPPEPTRDAIRIALHLQEEVRRAAGK